MTADCDGDSDWGHHDPSVFVIDSVRQLDGEYQVTNGHGPIIAPKVMWVRDLKYLENLMPISSMAIAPDIMSCANSSFYFLRKVLRLYVDFFCKLVMMSTRCCVCQQMTYNGMNIRITGTHS